MSKFEITQIPRFSAGACEASPSGTCPVGAVHEELSTQIAALSRENAALGEKIVGLKEQMGAIAKENEGLRATMQRMEAKLDQLTAQSAPVLEFWSGLTWGKRAIIGVVSIAAGLLTVLALFDQAKALLHR